VRRRLGAGVVGAVLVVLVPSAAQAALVADWRMDEGSGAGVMVDSAGGDNNGSVNSVVTGVAGLAGGRAYLFDGATSWVQVPDRSNLDPGTAPITVRATVQVANSVIVDDSYEVIRKGTVKTRGGEWKMEIKRSSSTVGRLNCVFKGVLPNGTTSRVSKVATVDVVDGRSHTLQCQRSGTQVVAVVDGRAFAVTQATGSIANAESLVIGSKVAGDDVMLGVIDAVSVNVG
jgi:hypothetical protein